jgi:hypothetical protein
MHVERESPFTTRAPAPRPSSPGEGVRRRRSPLGEQLAASDSVVAAAELPRGTGVFSALLRLGLSITHNSMRQCVESQRDSASDLDTRNGKDVGNAEPGERAEVGRAWNSATMKKCAPGTVRSAPFSRKIPRSRRRETAGSAFGPVAIPLGHGTDRVRGSSRRARLRVADGKC